MVQTSLKGYSTVTLFALFSEEDLFTIFFYQSYAMFVRTPTLQYSVQSFCHVCLIQFQFREGGINKKTLISASIHHFKTKIYQLQHHKYQYTSSWYRMVTLSYKININVKINLKSNFDIFLNGQACPVHISKKQVSRDLKPQIILDVTQNLSLRMHKLSSSNCM